MNSKKVVAIHQPDFLPYLGFFHRLFHCDVFVFLDHVQLLKRGWHHRDKIKGPNGEHWLTVPISRKAKRPPISGAEINYNQNWIDKHLKTIHRFYCKTPYFNHVFPEIEKIYLRKYCLLEDLNLSFIKYFMEMFSINIEFIFSSDLNVESSKSELILDIVKILDGTHYYTGTGSKNYLDIDLFDKHGIKVVWQDFSPPIYPQLFGQFIPYLSSLDFVMNCGKSIRKYI